MYAPEEGAVDDTVGMRKMDWKEVMAASASDGESLVEVEPSAAAAMAMVIVMRSATPDTRSLRYDTSSCRQTEEWNTLFQ